MDLDTVAWDTDAATPTRCALKQSQQHIAAFMEAHDAWVIEGCYADLLALALPSATELVFLNPGAESCISNARKRPWEPHKYASPEAQNANLDMLISWIAQYEQREDEFSLQAHQKLFATFHGKKTEYLANIPGLG
jgi:hypothetical protein